MYLKEDLLHYVWRLRYFDADALATTEGAPIEILHSGLANNDAGPDFSNAIIRIDGTLWAGNVEIHVTASEWQRHGHHEDKGYDNVILHVVYEEDLPAHRSNGQRIPCLELRGRLMAGIVRRYREFVQNSFWIPCQAHIPEVPAPVRSIWLERLVVERLEQKTLATAQLLASTGNDWETCCYRLISRYLGGKVNAFPFEQLAQQTPLRMLQRHADNLLQTEALLFGQAGLLDEPFEEEYPRRLQQEYAFLRSKYSLQPLPPAVWKFARMRPSGFPSLRIAQLAALLHKTPHFFSALLDLEQVASLRRMLEVFPSEYWQCHYRFGKPAPQGNHKTGQAIADSLIVNAVAPLLFCYGQHKDQAAYCDRAVALLCALPAERNTVMNQWTQIGCTPENAAESQGLLQLKTSYCDRKKCLSCAIGDNILKGK